MKTWSMLLMVVLILPLWGCSSGVDGDAEVLARINDYELSATEFKKQLLTELAEEGITKIDAAKRKEFLELIIRKELLIQEAKKRNLDRQEKFIRAIERYWESTLIRGLMDIKAKEASESVIVSKEELKAYYDSLGKKEELPPFDEMQDILEEQLREKKKSDSINQWIIDLRKNAAVEINEELLSKNM